MKIPMTRFQMWFSIIAVIAVPVIIILIWQSDKWYALYTEMVVRISRESKSKETKPIEKLARYDGLLFESELTQEQHVRVNELTKSFKQILILFTRKSIYGQDEEDIAQEMFAAERDPRGRDKYSRYQSRKGLMEERKADSSLAYAPTPKIIFGTTDTIAVIKILGFSSEIPDNLNRDIEVVTQFGVNKFVIDLRDNWGGLEDSAILSLGLFMRRDDIICTRKDKDGETIYNRRYLIRELKVLNFGKYQHLRQIVLATNKHTASAAEIFAGAMQSWGYAVIGEKTFGKGVGQNEFNLPAPAGSVFILTTRECFIGKEGKKLDRVGVKPDLLIKDVRSTQADEQMEAAIKFLQNTNPRRN